MVVVRSRISPAAQPQLFFLFLLVLVFAGTALANNNDDVGGLVLPILSRDGQRVFPTPIPLQGMEIDATIVDGIARVSMDQEFFVGRSAVEDLLASERKLQEANITETGAPTSYYQLPIDSTATITAFRAFIGDRQIEGVVKERQQAKAEFDTAIEEGKAAFLLEAKQSDIFLMSVGNIPWDTVVRVQLVYAAPLKALTSTKLRWVLPTRIAPRYVPAHDRESPQQDTVTGGGQDLLNDGVKINFRLLGADETIVQVISKTHQIKEQTAVSGLESREFSIVSQETDPLVLDLWVDFTFTTSNDNAGEEISTSNVLTPHVYAERNPDNGNSLAMLLSVVLPDFLPGQFDDITITTEYIFVVDLSGSMDDKIEATRSALSTVLEVLPSSSFVNFVFFGFEFEWLFPVSQALEDSSAFATMRERVTNLEANLGGTDLAPPMEAVMMQEPIESVQERVVLLLTDAAVSNTLEVIKIVENNLDSRTRAFALGLGPHVGRVLVNGIAQSGGGTAEYATGLDEADLVETVTRQIRSTFVPRITDVQVNWGNREGHQAPFRPPPMFTGKRFLIFYLFDDEEVVEVPSTVVLTADAYGQELRFTIGEQNSSIARIDGSQIAIINGDLVHKMAAREWIRDLEEGRSSIHQQQGVNTTDQVRAEIVRVGVKYQIPSSETSFIAIDTSTNEGMPEVDQFSPEYTSTATGFSVHVLATLVLGCIGLPFLNWICME